MTLEGIKNLWTLPPEGCSNSLKSTIYFERAKLLLNELEQHRVPGAARLTRLQIARRIGCSAATLNQNKRVLAVVMQIDRLQAAQDSATAILTNVQRAIQRLPLPALSAHRLPLNSTRSWLLFTDESCVVNGSPHPGIPTIAFCDGIDETSADWFRFLAAQDTLELGTLDTYADLLRPFLVFCRERGVPLQDIDDRLLIRWRRHMRQDKGTSKKRADESTGLVFKYLLWCDETGILQDHVARYDPGELPDRLRGHKFPIGAVRFRLGNGRLVWVSSLIRRSKDRGVGNRATPTDDEIADLHKRALRSKHGLRNSTMLSVAHDAGARRFEFLQLKIWHLPKPHELQRLIETGDDWVVKVRRKGGIQGILKLSVDCLLKIFRYLRAREKFVEEMLLKQCAYKAPDDVFLSDRGGPLKPDSVTALMKQLFVAVGVKRANIHRLRAKFAIECVEVILDSYLEGGIEFAPGSSWIDTVLTRVAQRMGHANPNSLKHYLDYVLERRLRTSEAALRRASLHAEREARLETERLIKKLRTLKFELAEESPKELADCLEELAGELRSQSGS